MVLQVQLRQLILIKMKDVHKKGLLTLFKMVDFQNVFKMLIRSTFVHRDRNPFGQQFLRSRFTDLHINLVD